MNITFAQPERTVRTTVSASKLTEVVAALAAMTAEAGGAEALPSSGWVPDHTDTDGELTQLLHYEDARGASGDAYRIRNGQVTSLVRTVTDALPDARAYIEARSQSDGTHHGVVVPDYNDPAWKAWDGTTEEYLASGNPVRELNGAWLKFRIVTDSDSAWDAEAYEAFTTTDSDTE